MSASMMPTSGLLCVRPAYPNSALSDDNELSQPLGMFVEHPVEPCDLRREVLRSEAEQNDACVRHALPEDEFAEITVVRDQDAPLPAGNVEHFVVVQGSRMIADDRGD